MRVLYHVTGIEAYKQIVKDGYLKPGPKNVWVDRKPTGYVRKGGVVWLCTKQALPRVKEHLARLGKDNRMIVSIYIDETKLTPFRPWPGVYMSKVNVWL
jgi:hypothetical protein